MKPNLEEFLKQITDIIGIKDHPESFIRQLVDTAQLKTTTQLIEELPEQKQKELLSTLEKIPSANKLGYYYQVFGKENYDQANLQTLAVMLEEIIRDIMPALSEEKKLEINNLLNSIKPNLSSIK